MTPRTIRNYKALADATPALQEAIEAGKVTVTSALGIIRRIREIVARVYVK